MCKLKSRSICGPLLAILYLALSGPERVVRQCRLVTASFRRYGLANALLTNLLDQKRVEPENAGARVRA